MAFRYARNALLAELFLAASVAHYNSRIPINLLIPAHLFFLIFYFGKVVPRQNYKRINQELLEIMHATELEDWATFGKIRQAEEKASRPRRCVYSRPRTKRRDCERTQENQAQEIRVEPLGSPSNSILTGVTLLS
jgi:hypothetical protein